MSNERFVTADGSHSLRSTRFGVPYHSVHGAVAESRHVFIEAGLNDAVDRGLSEIAIIETGFGTGLNALLSWDFARRHPQLSISYRGLELHPLLPEVAATLNYPATVPFPPRNFQQLHSAGWNEWDTQGNFRFRKEDIDFSTGLARLEKEHRADVLYFDAFAPSSQPELWETPLLGICFAALRPGGVLVTYCAQGQFKRNLRAVGFEVEPLPGPPGKREMTRARRPLT